MTTRDSEAAAKQELETFEFDHLTDTYYYDGDAPYCITQATVDWCKGQWFVARTNRFFDDHSDKVYDHPWQAIGELHLANSEYYYLCLK